MSTPHKRVQFKVDDNALADMAHSQKHHGILPPLGANVGKLSIASLFRPLQDNTSQPAQDQNTRADKNYAPEKDNNMPQIQANSTKVTPTITFGPAQDQTTQHTPVERTKTILSGLLRYEHYLNNIPSPYPKDTIQAQIPMPKVYLVLRSSAVLDPNDEHLPQDARPLQPIHLVAAVCPRDKVPSVHQPQHLSYQTVRFPYPSQQLPSHLRDTQQSPWLLVIASQPSAYERVEIVTISHQRSSAVRYVTEWVGNVVKKCFTLYGEVVNVHVTGGGDGGLETRRKGICSRRVGKWVYGVTEDWKGEGMKMVWYWWNVIEVDARWWCLFEEKKIRGAEGMGVLRGAGGGVMLSGMSGGEHDDEGL